MARKVGHPTSKRLKKLNLKSTTNMMFQVDLSGLGNRLGNLHQL